MSRDLVTVANWANTEEAHAAKNYLEANGIRAVLADEMTVANAWQLSNAIGWVKLLVTADDASRATELLEVAREQAATSPAVAWRCAKCGERGPAAFNVCWKCGAERELPESPQPDDADALPLAEEKPARRSPADGEPVDEDVESPSIRNSADLARRAWFASVRAFVLLPLLPLLSIYSVSLLLRLSEPLPPRARLLCRAAWVANAAAFLALMLFLAHILHD